MTNKKHPILHDYYIKKFRTQSHSSIMQKPGGNTCRFFLALFPTVSRNVRRRLGRGVNLILAVMVII